MVKAKVERKRRGRWYITNVKYPGNKYRLVLYRYPIFEGRDIIYFKREGNVIKVRTEKGDGCWRRRLITYLKDKYPIIMINLNNDILVKEVKEVENGLDIILETAA